ncbi:MAG TPA: ectonucleotide pyrophosphatase/phosphodiesterase [Bacteroidales bacterium]|nr:ectonucleotide pyrophosphatase/phosphodiesterase [Bacteroidales bacterium]
MQRNALLLIFSLLIALVIIAFVPESKPKDEYLVVLSMDGFRWDYLQRAHTPNLDELFAKGVRAERFIPSFPTTTFANHYTMATGLRPGKHGIVANSFYDPVSGRYFNRPGHRKSVEDGSFYGGEPIWVTAETQGMTTATCFWVGSEADVKGIRPSYWKRYQHNMPFIDRIDTVLYWLQLPEQKRPRLVMWYMDEPDSKGHFLGPLNDSIVPLIQHLDSLFGVFHSRLKALPHYDQINIIVVSDHGMAQLDPSKRVLLDHYVDTSLIVDFDGYSPVINFRIKEGYAETFCQQLAKVPHIRFWRRGQAPDRLEAGTHPRLHDVTVLADDSYSIDWSYRISRSRGAHGYDNANPDMHGIFLAKGPSFRNDGYLKKPFHNIHLYGLMAEILQLKPAQTDGSRDSILDLLNIRDR